MKVKITLEWSGVDVRWRGRKQHVRVSRVGDYPALPNRNDRLHGNPLPDGVSAQIIKNHLLIPGGCGDVPIPYSGIVEASVSIKDKWEHKELAEAFAELPEWRVEIRTEGGPDRREWAEYNSGNIDAAF